MKSNDELAVGLSKHKKSISLIWVAPMIAVMITAGMIWKNYVNAGIRITIIVNNGDGIKNGKTPIMYKGIQVGIVENVHIKKDDVSKLELTALIDKDASAGVARKGNQFWKVSPKISLTEVTGLSTIIGGVYIAVMPAAADTDTLNALPYQDYFIGLDTQPIDVFNPGLPIVVQTKEKGDISIGAPVFYNKLEIGKVEDKRLSQDKSGIDLYLRINSAYTDLIHEKSIFYKRDALEVKASLSEVKVNMGSFASFITGGISMYNSNESLASPLVGNQASFHLYNNYDETVLSKDEIILLMQEHENLKPGLTKLYYKGVKAGLVTDVFYEPKSDQTEVKIKIDKKFRDFANEKAHFWIVQPRLDFDKIEGLDAIAQGSYINFHSTDPDAKHRSSFVLHDKAPQKEGVHIRLLCDDVHSLKEGAGLFYRSIEIGVLSSYALNNDNKTFTLDMIIEPKYAKLINTSSLFYQSSGIELEAGLDGLELNTGSLETIIRGGIAVETPNMKAETSLKKTYTLYGSQKDLRKAEYLSQKGIHLKLLADKLGSLKEGSPVYFNQIEVGQLLSYKWDAQARKVIMELFIVDEYAKEVHDDSLFYNASGIDAKFDLTGFEINTESIESIVTGGIAFYTPSSITSKPARNHEQFYLHETKAIAMDKYSDVILYSKDSYGLITGNLLMYKSVVIGHVDNVRLVKEGVELDLKINKKYAYLIKEDTLFWTEAFEMSLQGIENFSAALKGTFIVLQPGVSQKDGDFFNLMSKAPLPHLNEKGLRIVVQAKRLGGIKENTPLYYRQIKIGSVVQHRLNDDSTAVDVELFVEPCYAHLVRGNSYFYNTSGIGMEIGLFSAKVKTETLDSILTGGIAVLTPDKYTDPAKDSQLFILHDEFDESALLWAPSLRSNDPMCH